MAIVIQALGLSVIGAILLWFGYTLFFLIPKESRRRPAGPSGSGRPKIEAERPSVHFGGSRTCPVCSGKLAPGEQVKSSVFPKFPGQDRVMHIFGCLYCLRGDRQRTCPVCGATLRDEDFLVARMFEKSARPHVHVLGCSRCRLRKF